MGGARGYTVGGEGQRTQQKYSSEATGGATGGGERGGGGTGGSGRKGGGGRRRGWGGVWRHGWACSGEGIKHEKTRGYREIVDTLFICKKTLHLNKKKPGRLCPRFKAPYYHIHIHTNNPCFCPWLKLLKDSKTLSQRFFTVPLSLD